MNTNKGKIGKIRPQQLPCLQTEITGSLTGYGDTVSRKTYLRIAIDLQDIPDWKRIEKRFQIMVTVIALAQDAKSKIDLAIWKKYHGITGFYAGC